MDRDGPHDPDEKRPAAGPSGAQESRSKTGHTETGIAVKIQSETTTTLAYYIIRTVIATVIVIVLVVIVVAEA